MYPIENPNCKSCVSLWLCPGQLFLNEHLSSQLKFQRRLGSGLLLLRALAALCRCLGLFRQLSVGDLQLL